MNIDHVGIAVASIEEALPFYREALGLEVSHREEVAAQGVTVAFLQAGETALELLEPLGEGGAVAKFLKTRGPGLHHVAFKAPGLKDQMARLALKGLPALEPEPRPGARGHRVCFLHPKHAHGVLVELVEEA
ncbi:MAG: methylmalonyl-CoA epimerase [Elusimicrobia bacterium]|nr:methylmalonyl-CoA epimerase [Elusimicrobiota bacterium]